jgi:hypothetical protein
MFSVLFEGEMDGSSGAANWLGGFLGKNSIGLNDAPPDPLDVGAITNLSILKDGGISEEHGNACFFESDSFPTGDYLIHQAFIKEGKGGRAESSIWLHGKTILGQEDILYVLKLYGQFDPEIAWPPVDEKTPHSIIFTDWELVIEGGGKNKNDSCSGDGETTVYVTVNVES